MRDAASTSPWSQTSGDTRRSTRARPGRKRARRITSPSEHDLSKRQARPKRPWKQHHRFRLATTKSTSLLNYAAVGAAATGYSRQLGKGVWCVTVRFYRGRSTMCAEPRLGPKEDEIQARGLIGDTLRRRLRRILVLFYDGSGVRRYDAPFLVSWGVGREVVLWYFLRAGSRFFFGCFFCRSDATRSMGVTIL